MHINNIKCSRTPAVEGKVFKIIQKSRKEDLRIFLTGGAYAPYAPCLITALPSI